MSFAFAYVQGQERQALAFYKRRLELTTDPEQRKELQLMVEHLQRVVEKSDSAEPEVELSIQNAVAGTT